jgi:hypothetical protein
MEGDIERDKRNMFVYIECTRLCNAVATQLDISGFKRTAPQPTSFEQGEMNGCIQEVLEEVLCEVVPGQEVVRFEGEQVLVEVGLEVGQEVGACP